LLGGFTLSGRKLEIESSASLAKIRIRKTFSKEKVAATPLDLSAPTDRLGVWKGTQ
jgi:hypothetical protein